MINIIYILIISLLFLIAYTIVTILNIKRSKLTGKCYIRRTPNDIIIMAEKIIDGQTTYRKINDEEKKLLSLHEHSFYRRYFKKN